MFTNVSKEKRDKLIEKIQSIKQFIALSPQDENTSQLLSYILLYKNGYLHAEWNEEVFNKVMEQAECFKRYN